MTDSEIIQQFIDLVDDDSTLTDTLKIQLANNAKNKLEREMKLEIIKALDSSNTTAAGQTYTTAKALPAAFRGLATDRIYVGTSPYFPVPFDRSVEYRESGGNRFYLDTANNNLHLCGIQTSAQTITIPYLKKTTDITQASIDAGTTTVIWPTEFHFLIPFDMVKLFDQIERGEKGRSWKPEWELEYSVGKNAMRDWDADLKLSAIGRSTPYGETDGQDNVALGIRY